MVERKEKEKGGGERGEGAREGGHGKEGREEEREEREKGEERVKIELYIFLNLHFISVIFQIAN